MTWYDKNMLFGDLMSNVDESVNESESLGEDPIALDEPNEDEVKHDPFEFLNHYKILFSRLLSNSKVWQVQGFNNGNVNMNMPLVQIIIPEPNAQQTLINTLDIQVDPFINPPNIVVDDKLGILHWSQVWARIWSLTQVHPKLHIQILQVLKMQDLSNQ
jgi:hypothetical protein